MQGLQDFFRYVVREWDALSLPTQPVLSTWFTILENTLAKARKRGDTEDAGWFQTQEGLQLTRGKRNQTESAPIYDVVLFPLPSIKRFHIRFSPIIASTTAAAGTVFAPLAAAVAPDFAASRLDLWMNAADGIPPVPDGIRFVKTQDLVRFTPPVYELEFLSGKGKVSAGQAQTIKGIFDASMKKLPAPYR